MNDKIHQNSLRWRRHAEETNHDSLVKEVVHYRPKGRRDPSQDGKHEEGKNCTPTP